MKQLKPSTRKTLPNSRAFPVFVDGKVLAAGLTKREYFAAAILQGLIAYPDGPNDLYTLTSDAVKLADRFIEVINNE